MKCFVSDFNEIDSWIRSFQPLLDEDIRRLKLNRKELTDKSSFGKYFGGVRNDDNVKRVDP